MSVYWIIVWARIPASILPARCQPKGHSNAPVIVLTGSDDPQVDFEVPRELGAADFLLKDNLDPVMLERVIRYSLQHAATLKALQKSHERFRLLFERSMDAILISDDSGRFVEVNSAACSLCWG